MGMEHQNFFESTTLNMENHAEYCSSEGKPYRWGLNVNPCCTHCSLEEETMEDMFYKCPWVWRVWRALEALSKGMPFNHDFQGIISSLRRRNKSKLVKFKQSVIAHTVWEICIDRNKAVLSRETRIVMLVKQQALATAVERSNVVECAIDQRWVN